MSVSHSDDRVERVLYSSPDLGGPKIMVSEYIVLVIQLSHHCCVVLSMYNVILKKHNKIVLM